MAASNSTAAFLNALKDYDLMTIKDKFYEHGYDTFSNFGFSCWNVRGQSEEKFDQEVLPKLAKETDSNEKKLIPRIRKLYALSWVHTQAGLEMDAKPSEEKVAIPPADHQDRLTKLRARLVGFTVQGQNQPSKALVDKLHNTLVKGVVKFIKWEFCTSHEQQMADEPEVKGLRITSDGLLLQDVQADLRTDLSGELLWDFALRRRSCAADVSGLASFESFNAWHETLKTYLLKPVPSSYKKISWQQLKNADEALFQYVSTKCEGYTKKESGQSMTNFEKHWKDGMFDPDVRMMLQPLPAGSSASSSSSPSTALALPSSPAGTDNVLAKQIKQLQHQLRQQSDQLASAKRKIENQGGRPTGGGGGGAKGRKGGKKGGGKGGDRGFASRAPAEWGDWPTHDDDRRAICFSYNLSNCSNAQDGARCPKGWHICPICFGKHKASKCDKK